MSVIPRDHPSVQAALAEMQKAIGTGKITDAVVMAIEHKQSLRVVFKRSPKGGIRTSIQLEDANGER